MYCFCCGDENLSQISSDINNFSLNCNNCKGFLGYFDISFELEYCETCNLYSIAKVINLNQDLSDSNKRYKLNNCKDFKVICLIDDCSNKAENEERLSDMIINAFKVKDLGIIKMTDIHYFSCKDTTQYTIEEKFSTITKPANRTI